MKRFFLPFVFFMLILPLSAESVKNPRGFSIGLYGAGDFPLADYAEFCTANAGGGLGVELAIPLGSDNFSIGFSARSSFRYGFVNPNNSVIDSLYDLDFLAGFFVRLGFSIGKLQMAFVPELSYGGLCHFVQPKPGIFDLNNFYMDQIMTFAPSLRFVLPADLEIEAAPVYAISFEKEIVPQQIGGRIGLLWHISDFVKNKK